MIQSIEEGRKEDGNRSIADKIIKRLHDLEKTVQNNHGRWAWELLQNAKDSVAESERKVSVSIIYDDDRIEFLHNGNHFTEKDIRGLINQISSKEVEEGQISTRTGRFGTGFLTTHLLSKLVIIKGVVETEEGEFYKFNFPLDRNGTTTVALIPNIENAWKQFHISTEQNSIDNTEDEEFSTSFTYPLTSDSQKEIARIGIDEFIALIPYVLTFISEIEKVEIVDNTKSTTITFLNSSIDSDGFKKVKKVVDGNQTIVRLLHLTDGRVSIAVRVKKSGAIFEILSVEDIPKLFCDFPLIGSENFHFPVVINSFFFNPQTERDGVWLMGDSDAEVIENKELIEQALGLYMDLINDISQKSFTDLFYISNTKIPAVDEKYFDKDWYKESIQSPLRDFIKGSRIVDLQDGKKGFFGELWFPMKSYSESVKENLWQFTFDLFPHLVCKKEHLHEWIDVSWEGINRISYAELLKDIEGKKSMGGLKENFAEDEQAAFNWLNKVGKFVMEDEDNLLLFDKNAVIPNENGDFLLKKNLFLDEIHEPNLIKILQLLEDDWNDVLLHHNIAFGSYFVKKKSEIAQKITENLKNISNQNPDCIEAISILTEWFDNNQEEGKDLFPENYRRRAELFMNTIEDKDSLYKVMRSKTSFSKIASAIEENPRLFEDIERIKDLENLMKEYNVADLNQLREALEGNNTNVRQPLLPITQEILTNMGISSIKEWEEAIADKDLSALFSHQSMPTTDMFIYVQTLITKAKAKIIEQLEQTPGYDLSELDDTTAPTILAGITKHGTSISIVARPAYNGEVIIYYGSERDILDFEPSELWIDDGVKPRKITLGHLLKSARIVKFPI